jgi:hypothetical protein
MGRNPKNRVKSAGLQEKTIPVTFSEKDIQTFSVKRDFKRLLKRAGKRVFAL